MPSSTTPKVRFWYTYILLNKKDNKFYIGFTPDLKKRFEAHNNRLVKATKPRRPLILIYYEACLNKYDAMRRENYLKSSDGHFYIKRRLREYLAKPK